MSLFFYGIHGVNEREYFETLSKLKITDLLLLSKKVCGHHIVAMNVPN